MAVRARTLEAQRTDARRRLIAIDSVRVWQADLAAVADSAVYDRIVAQDSSAGPKPPRPPSDSARPSPDSVRTYASRLDSLIAESRPPALKSSSPVTPTPVREDAVNDMGPADSTQAESERAMTARSETTEADSTEVPPGQEALLDSGEARGERMAIPDSVRRVQDDSLAETSEGWESPAAEPGERLPLEETRLFSSPITWFERAQVWGDSIRVRAHERSLDTVYVRGSAFAAQMDTTLDRIQQLKGQDITAYFQADSLRRLLARPNGQAIRFMASENERTLRGAAKSSGDRIMIRFRQGTVRRISIIGGVQSSYYRKPEHIPDPFRLEGFQWTPDRKPTKRRLLRGPRVRQKLGLEEELRSPLATQGNAADSVQSMRVPTPYGEGSSGSDVSTGRGQRSRVRANQLGLLDVLFRPSDSLWMRPLHRTNEVADTTDTINPEN